jgi:hypothetical protein
VRERLDDVHHAQEHDIARACFLSGAERGSAVARRTVRGRRRTRVAVLVIAPITVSRFTTWAYKFAVRIPGMHAHLAGCPACDEDHASLLAFVASEQATGG